MSTGICRRCFAVVDRENIEFHRLWHAEAEGLERPYSEHGFWGMDGSWNRASGALNVGDYL